MLRLRVRIQLGAWMSVFCEYLVLSGRILYIDWQIGMRPG
jgi:hypothetical protein